MQLHRACSRNTICRAFVDARRPLGACPRLHFSGEAGSDSVVDEQALSAWKIDDIQLLPPSVQDYVPKGHLSRFVVGPVRESLDLKEIEGSYNSETIQPPFDPRQMAALLLHGDASGLYSSRRRTLRRRSIAG